MNAIRAALLRELRIGPIWRLRGAAVGSSETDCEGEGEGRAASQTSMPTLNPDSTGAPPGDQAIASDSGQPAVTQTPVSARQLDSEPTQPVPNTVRVPPEADEKVRIAHISTVDWNALDAEIHQCDHCQLHAQRRQAVPGTGDHSATWMFVGEGPGAQEDRLGEPFVGPAGKLLDGMLRALGLDRSSDVFITNAVKCRPPMNRTPTEDEIAHCRPFLMRQIELVQPRVLVALGKPAAQALLQTDIAIKAARGKHFEYEGIPVVVSFHPAYLLRNPSEKAKAWEDLCLARRIIKSGGAC